jgi:hypothetical protein|tara:strand:+ start:715 stop:1398 length:684 start_codon:yes stop_codon:yes gene_type:complete
MKNINSVLLPGEFFKNNFIEKTEKLMTVKVDTVYLFDHGVNPADKNLDVYELTDGIYKLNEVVNNKFSLGACVLNINARPYQELFDKYIHKFLEIKNFKLGIGTGDDKFEKRINFSNDIEKIIKEIVDSNKFKKNNISLFVGGNSEKILKLMEKFEIGINQWIGTKNSFEEKEMQFSQIKHPKGNLSLCSLSDNPNFFDSKLNYEKIHVLKDSNRKIFFETIDNIFR